MKKIKCKKCGVLTGTWLNLSSIDKFGHCYNCELKKRKEENANKSCES